MTPNPFQTAQAVFSPDPDDPRLEVVRFERDDQRVGTGYCYERDVEPSAHQQQRMEHVAAAGWLPRPGADTIGDVWEVEHRALGWDGLVPGMSGTATITNVTEHGADVTVTSEDGERLEHVGATLTSGTTDGPMGQQLAHELRELGWDVAGDELTDGQVVTWRGSGEVETIPQSTGLDRRTKAVDLNSRVPAHEFLRKVEDYPYPDDLGDDELIFLCSCLEQVVDLAKTATADSRTRERWLRDKGLALMTGTSLLAALTAVVKFGMPSTSPWLAGSILALLVIAVIFPIVITFAAMHEAEKERKATLKLEWDEKQKRALLARYRTELQIRNRR